MLDKVKWFVKVHSGEIAIVAIATGILMGIALATTGDIGQVLAKGRH